MNARAQPERRWPLMRKGVLNGEYDCAGAAEKLVYLFRSPDSPGIPDFRAS